jgi:hypothetical protein
MTAAVKSRMLLEYADGGERRGTLGREWSGKGDGWRAISEGLAVAAAAEQLSDKMFRWEQFVKSKGLVGLISDPIVGGERKLFKVLVEIGRDRSRISCSSTEQDSAR